MKNKLRSENFGEFGQWYGLAAAAVNNVLIGIGSAIQIADVTKASKQDVETAKYLSQNQLQLTEEQTETRKEIARQEAESIKLANRGLITVVIVGGIVSLSLVTLLLGVVYTGTEKQK